MWTELPTLESERYALLGVSEDELRRLPFGAVEMYIEREDELNYTGDIVICCRGETRFFGFLRKGEKRKRNGRERWVYCISELRKCVEIPCPELGEKVGMWHFEPREALIEYPTVLKKDWERERSLGKWRVRWWKLALYGAFVLISLVAGALVWLLSAWCPWLVGLLAGVYVFLVWYKAAKLSL